MKFRRQYFSFLKYQLKVHTGAFHDLAKAAMTAAHISGEALLPAGYMRYSHAARTPENRDITHAIRSINFFSSPYVTTRPYSLVCNVCTFLISLWSSSSRRSRCAERSNRGSSSNESRRAESERVGEGGALPISSKDQVGQQGKDIPHGQPAGCRWARRGKMTWLVEKDDVGWTRLALGREIPKLGLA